MKHLFILIFAATAIASCNPDTIDLSNAGMNSTTRAVSSQPLADVVDTLTLINGTTAPITYADLGASQKMGIAVQVPVIPDDFIEPVGLTAQFEELAKLTDGSASYVDAAREITSTFIGILDTHLVDNTDLVFVIDATASMLDDIANVKRGVITIIKHVQEHENVRVGIAIYRDKADDGAIWFDYLQLTDDYQAAIDYVNAIAPCCGGIDWPESVYDGTCAALDSMDWRENNPKMLLLLGDAPALLGPRTEHTLEDVVSKSKEHGVAMNFYPVIITTEIAFNVPAVSAVKVNSFFTGMYPNPSAGDVTVELNKTDNYTWTVADLAGSTIESGSGYTNKIQLNLSALPDGVYNVMVMQDGVTENKLIVVAH